MDILKGFQKEFGWFIWGLVGLGFIWFFTGGLESNTAREPFIKPLAPLDSGETYGPYFSGSAYKAKQTLYDPEDPTVLLEKAESKVETFLEQTKPTEQVIVTSLLSQIISFDGNAGSRNETPDTEYIRIVANKSAEKPVQISGLSISGRVKRVTVTIPTASELPILGVTAIKKNVVLPPGGRALISSGRSPIGTSFRVNMCTGYLDQFQEYTPGLLKNCPEPETELLKFGPANEPSCREFVEDIPRCRVYTGSFPDTISSTCRDFVIEHLNYNACVANHKNETGFFANEWRLFLDRESELWGNKNEIIRLIDTNGKTIDAITY